MSQSRLVWEGLDQLKAELRRLPADLVGEATPIVHAHAAAAEQAIAQVYANSTETGALARSLSLKPTTAGRFGINETVITTAPHAWLFEHGSQTRQTRSGANRGVMPATPTFTPTVIRERHAMYDALAAMLARVTGFRVTGSARG